MNKNLGKKKKILKRLGINIKFYRNKLGFTQEQLSEIINAERSYVTAIENGSKSPSLYFLYELAEALKIELKDLTDIKIN